MLGIKKCKKVFLPVEWLWTGGVEAADKVEDWGLGDLELDRCLPY